MSVVFVTEETPASESDLEELERNLNITLPTEYRSFLLQRNGGRVQDNDLATREGEEIGIAVRSFLSVGSGVHDSIDDFLAVYHDRYPRGFLPIAEAAGGNLILLKVENPEKGKIYFWDHELEGDEEVTWENITLLSSSFNQFVDALIPYAG